MRRIASAVVFVLAVVVQTPAHAVRDSWTGPDKLHHFAGGVVVGGLGTLATQRKDFGAGLGCAAGLAKEMADRKGSGFSARDWGVTCAGALLGAWVGDYFVHATRRGVTVSRAF